MAPPSRLRSASRKDSPLSPPKASLAASAPGASNQNKRKTRSASREVTAAQKELQNIEKIIPRTVDEEDEEVFVPEENEALESESSLHDASFTGLSPQELVKALDRNAIIDDLEDLYNDSIALIAEFETTEEQRLQETCAALLQPGTRPHRRFEKKADRFYQTRKAYGGNHLGDNAEFIRSEIVLRRISNLPEPEIIPGGSWRPDGVLCIANLALQLIKFTSSSEEVHWKYVKMMFGNYPEPFYEPVLAPFGKQVYIKTLEFQIEILTQYFINKAEEEFVNPNFDPDKALGDVFFNENGTVKAQSTKAAHVKVLERMQLIKDHFNTTEQLSIDLEGLQQTFPWSSFVVEAVKWSLARKQELCEIIDSKGGIEKLEELLQAGDFQTGAAETQEMGESQFSDLENSQPTDESDDQQEASPTGTLQPVNIDPDPMTTRPRVPQRTSQEDDSHIRPIHAAQQNPARHTKKMTKIKANRNQLKAFKSKHAATNRAVQPLPQLDPTAELVHEILQSPTPAVDSEIEPALMDEDFVADLDEVFLQPPSRAESDTPEESEIIATQQTNLVLQTVRRQNEQSNKENAVKRTKKPSLLDPQPGAIRIEPPSDDDESLPTRTSPKRKRLPTVDESDEDELNFETDTRASKRPRVQLIERSNRPASTDRVRLASTEDFTGGMVDEGDEASAPPRSMSSRPRARAIASAERPRRTLPFASSQPARSATGMTSSNRAPLRAIVPGNRGLPSSSAPARPDRVGNASTVLNAARLPPSHQVQPRRRHVPSPSEEPPRTQEIAEVNRQAKERVQMSRDLMQTRRPAQTRKPYSHEEVERLMEMIEIYGTKWARILQEDSGHTDGPALQQRDQVNLKDKARNLKMDFLKAGRRLPPGFESVSVGNKLIESLRQNGIDYFEGATAARYAGRERSEDNEIED